MIKPKRGETSDLKQNNAVKGESKTYGTAEYTVNATGA